MRLDNAAKIYPPSRSRSGWMAMFRVSAEFCEKIDPDLLEKALVRTIKRFPTMALRLRRGLFWYYLEKIDAFPKVIPDSIDPCAPIDFKKNNGYMFKVRYYENRIALEFFHVLTDGTGGVTFLLTLCAEYISEKYGVSVPRGGMILDTGDEPSKDETEDAFPKFARSVGESRAEKAAYRFRGTPVSDYPRVTTGLISASQLKAKAKEHGATVTEYLLARMTLAIAEISGKKKIKKPIYVCVPVNLRKFYPTNTLRNFSSFVNVGIDPILGEYSFDEAIREISSQLRYTTSEKRLNARFSSNVHSEQNKLIRALPLPVKNFAMKIAYKYSGDRTSSTTLSNLGLVTLPEEMERFITRLDFMIGPLSKNPFVCACITYKDTLSFNVVRRIEEPDFERSFFTSLVKDGIHVKIESNSGRENANQAEKDLK